MRVGFADTGSTWATLDMCRVDSFSTIPPGSPIRGLVCRLTRLTPCTTTRCSAGRTRNTSPVLPLSRPAMTTTLSPFLIFSFGMASPRVTGSQHFGGERHDLHKPSRPQLAGDWSEDPGSDRFALLGDQHCGIAVEADRAAVDATDLLGSANDDGAMHVAFLHPAARNRFLDRDDDHIANRRGAAFGATQYFDALHSTRAGIVGDVEVCLHLDHTAPSAGATAPAPGPAAAGSAAAPRGRRSPLPSSIAPSTTQCLRFEIGRLSSIRIASPACQRLSLSCAAY